MKYYAEKLELEGNYVLSIVYPVKNKEDYTKEEINLLGLAHLKRIEISDAVFIVNKNGYIGEAVKREIAHAKKLNKEVIYLEKQLIKKGAVETLFTLLIQDLMYIIDK